MTAAERMRYISVEEYLAGELTSNVKHEYVAGFVYAMAGARNEHNVIAGNFFASMHAQLEGNECLPFNSDTKVRILQATHSRFYYPDGMVVCSENPRDDSFQDNPVVVAEVLSKSTFRTDEGEKREGYMTISSLKVLLLIESEEPVVVAYRRGDNGFSRELFSGLDTTIPLPEIDCELSLDKLYERIEFSVDSDTEQNIR